MQLYVFARFYFLQVQIQLHMMQANCAPGEPRHQNCIWHGIQKTDKSYGRCHLIVLLWSLENFLFHSWYLRSHTGSCCHCHVIASCLHIKSYKLTCTIMMVMLLTGRSDACSCRKAIANCFQYLSKKNILKNSSCIVTQDAPTQINQKRNLIHQETWYAVMKPNSINQIFIPTSCMGQVWHQWIAVALVCIKLVVHILHKKKSSLASLNFTCYGCFYVIKKGAGRVADKRQCRT